MKQILPLFLLLILSELCADTESPVKNRVPDKKVAVELEARTGKFLDKLAKGEREAAATFLFKAMDDPKLERAEMIAKSVEETLIRLLQHLASPESNPRFQKIRAVEQFKQIGHSIVTVAFWGFDPGQDEFEKREITWILTEKSGWKLVEL